MDKGGWDEDNKLTDKLEQSEATQLPKNKRKGLAPKLTFTPQARSPDPGYTGYTGYTSWRHRPKLGGTWQVPEGASTRVLIVGVFIKDNGFAGYTYTML